MKYYEAEFTINPCTQDAQDILSALAAEAGFETFEETGTGLKGYVQQQVLDQQVLDDLINDFPLADTAITYTLSEAEDRDWNEQWEQEGFNPIIVGEKLVIHDGRHLPDITRQQPSVTSIEIDAHLAFGTGTHETTRMICATLLDMQLSGKRILDCGCGTGILGITALKLGAASCTAYDIDEWSTENTRHNSIINGVDDRMTALLGDATLLDTMTGGPFDLVLANINRNILLQDMERFVTVMAPEATLVLSGFYQEDCEQLTHQAQHLGLTAAESQKDGDWACLLFKKHI